MSDVERAWGLYKMGKGDAARTLLEGVVAEGAQDAVVHALLAHLARAVEQREAHLRATFELSHDTRLSNWAFEELARFDKEGIEAERREPPVRSALDGQVLRDIARSKSVERPVPQVCSSEQGATPQVSTADLRAKERRSRRVPLKRIGVWIALIGGLILIVSVYYRPVLDIFVGLGISPFWCCTFPMIIIGAIVIVVGLFVDRR